MHPEDSANRSAHDTFYTQYLSTHNTFSSRDTFQWFLLELVIRPHQNWSFAPTRTGRSPVNIVHSRPHSSRLTTRGSQLTAHAHTASSQPTQFTAHIAHSSQLTSHSPPPTAHDSPPTTHNSQLTTHGSHLTPHTAQLNHTAQLTAYVWGPLRLCCWLSECSPIARYAMTLLLTVHYEWPLTLIVH